MGASSQHDYVDAACQAFRAYYHPQSGPGLGSRFKLQRVLRQLARAAALEALREQNLPSLKPSAWQRVLVQRIARKLVP